MGLNFTQESQGMPPYYTSNSGNGIEALLLASMFNRRDRDEDIPSRTVDLQNTSNLRRDVADVATEVHKLGNEVQMSFNEQTKDRADFSRLVFKEFADQTKDVHENFRDLDNRLCMTEKEIMTSRHLLSKEIMENTLRVKDEVVERAINLKDQITGLHHSMDKQFCHVNTEALKNKQDILDRLFADKLDEKNDEIARLRAKHDHITSQLQFSSQLNAINSSIADLSQHQRATQQTIQFGQGNLAGQSSNNNQVRT